MNAPVLAFPFVSASIPDAARAAGASETTVKDAISSGDLTAHYIGRRATKPVILATDLAAWITSLPTESGRGKP